MKKETLQQQYSSAKQYPPFGKVEKNIKHKNHTLLRE
jgi:hypothetical protein